MCPLTHKYIPLDTFSMSECFWEKYQEFANPLEKSYYDLGEFINNFTFVRQCICGGNISIVKYCSCELITHKDSNEKNYLIDTTNREILKNIIRDIKLKSKNDTYIHPDIKKINICEVIRAVSCLTIKFYFKSDETLNRESVENLASQLNDFFLNQIGRILQNIDKRTIIKYVSNDSQNHYFHIFYPNIFVGDITILQILHKSIHKEWRTINWCMHELSCYDEYVDNFEIFTTKINEISNSNSNAFLLKDDYILDLISINTSKSQVIPLTNFGTIMVKRRSEISRLKRNLRSNNTKNNESWKKYKIFQDKGYMFNEFEKKLVKFEKFLSQFEVRCTCDTIPHASNCDRINSTHTCRLYETFFSIPKEYYLLFEKLYIDVTISGNKNILAHPLIYRYDTIEEIYPEDKSYIFIEFEIVLNEELTKEAGTLIANRLLDLIIKGINTLLENADTRYIITFESIKRKREIYNSKFTFQFPYIRVSKYITRLLYKETLKEWINIAESKPKVWKFGINNEESVNTGLSCVPIKLTGEESRRHTNKVKTLFPYPEWEGNIENKFVYNCDKVILTNILPNGGSCISTYPLHLEYINDTREENKLTLDFQDTPENISFDNYLETYIWIGKIYMYTNRTTLKSYVGCTIHTVAKRWEEHIREASMQNMRKTYLNIAIKEYGPDGFDITTLEYITSFKEEDIKARLFEREGFWINEKNTYNDGYNMLRSGELFSTDSSFWKSRFGSSKNFRCTICTWRCMSGQVMEKHHLLYHDILIKMSDDTPRKKKATKSRKKKSENFTRTAMRLGKRPYDNLIIETANNPDLSDDTFQPHDIKAAKKEARELKLIYGNIEITNENIDMLIRGKRSREVSNFIEDAEKTDSPVTNKEGWLIRKDLGNIISKQLGFRDINDTETGFTKVELEEKVKSLGQYFRGNTTIISKIKSILPSFNENRIKLLDIQHLFVELGKNLKTYNKREYRGSGEDRKRTRIYQLY
jgi:hypothetical protein